MPHIRIEVSPNLESIKGLLPGELIKTCQETGYFEKSVLMARVIEIEYFKIQSSLFDSMVATTIQVRPGRSEEALKNLTASICKKVTDMLSEHHPTSRCCITCEAQEINVNTRSLTYKE